MAVLSPSGVAMMSVVVSELGGAVEEYVPEEAL